MNSFSISVQEVDTLHELKNKALKVYLSGEPIPQVLVKTEGRQIVINGLADKYDYALVFKRCFDQVKQRWMPEFG